MTVTVIFGAFLLTYLGARVCFGDWRKTGARLAHFCVGKLRQSAPVLGTPFRGSRLAQLAQTGARRIFEGKDWRNKTGATLGVLLVANELRGVAVVSGLVTQHDFSREMDYSMMMAQWQLLVIVLIGVAIGFWRARR